MFAVIENSSAVVFVVKLFGVCSIVHTLVSVGLPTLPHLSELSPKAHLSKQKKTTVPPRSQTSASLTSHIEVTRRLFTRNNIEHAVDILISFSLLYTRNAINMARHKQ